MASPKDTFTVNGIYYDSTSFEFAATGFKFDRVAREIQDISLEPTMDGVTDVMGTQSGSLGSNLGRAKVNNPSMTLTVEAFNELIASSQFQGALGFTQVEFDFTLLLKPKAGAPQIVITCEGARFLGWGTQSWSNTSNLLQVKVPMFVRRALWNGVPLVR